VPYIKKSVKHKMCQKCNRSLGDYCFKPAPGTYKGKETYYLLKQEEVRNSDISCENFYKISWWMALKKYLRQMVFNAKMRRIEKKYPQDKMYP
jgi:hypothetical protein